MTDNVAPSIRRFCILQEPRRLFCLANQSSPHEPLHDIHAILALHQRVFANVVVRMFDQQQKPPHCLVALLNQSNVLLAQPQAQQDNAPPHPLSKAPPRGGVHPGATATPLSAQSPCLPPVAVGGGAHHAGTIHSTRYNEILHQLSTRMHACMHRCENVVSTPAKSTLSTINHTVTASKGQTYTGMCVEHTTHMHTHNASVPIDELKKHACTLTTHKG